MTSESSDPEREASGSAEPRDSGVESRPVQPVAGATASSGPFAEAAPAPEASPPEPAPALPAPPRRRPLRRLFSTVAFVGALVLVGYVVFSGVQNLVNENPFHDRIAETEAEIQQLQTQAKQLAALIAYLDSDAYIERTAREDLGMVRPGEEAFAVHAPARSGLEISRSPWWANLLPESAATQYGGLPGDNVADESLARVGGAGGDGSVE